MLAWMLHAAAVGVLLCGAALALDAAARLTARAARWAWALALVAALVLPALALLPAPPKSVAPAGVVVTDRAGDAALAERLLALARERRPALEVLDTPLAAAWALASLVLLARLAVAHRRLRRASAAWPRRAVGGRPVRVAPDVGPAVVGVWRAEVVLPEWALSADTRRLELMLAHEREHLRAHDPLLLGAASLAVVLAPWNPALWVVRRRLALAVEVDCDRRVLRAGGDALPYGHLLLDVARRAPARWPLPATPLAARASHLERRIAMLAARPPRHRVARAAALVIASVALVAAACETPRPTAPSTLGGVVATSPQPTTVAPMTDDDVRAQLARHVPDVLTSATGRLQRVWLVQDPAGSVYQVLGEREGAPSLVNLDPNTIAAMEVRRVAAGRLAPDSLAIVTIRLGTPPDRRSLPKRSARSAADSADARAAASAAERGAERLPERVRSASAAASAAPMFVVDGRELVTAAERAALDAMPPSAIDHVEVLKGDAAVRRFGERARGGAVVVTTKGS